ncbi:type ISP restriction/modification enzyme [Candidatus Harpocratesius sp.]
MEKKLLHIVIEYAESIDQVIHDIISKSNDSPIIQLIEIFPFMELTKCEKSQLPKIFAHTIPFISILSNSLYLESDKLSKFLIQFETWCKNQGYPQIIQKKKQFIDKLNQFPIISFILNKDTNRKDKNNSIFSNLQKISISKLSELILNEIYIPFLKEYDRQHRQQLGIIFTPAFIVLFILDTIDSLLKKLFALPEGLASSNYIYYDPAVGPLSFEIGFMQRINSYNKNINSPQINIKMYGNEIKPEIYFIGMILTEYLKSLYKIKELNQIIKISFNSALEPINLKMFREDNTSDRIPLIIVGNPPYSVSSANKEGWITNLMQKYAVPEPNLTRLYDDYVKFFRYSDWLLEQHGMGIIAFISNRKFLDGKIFYGFRQAMANSFDKIYIIDLFGDVRNPKNSANEGNANIFNIKTGVCISFFCKTRKKEKSNQRIKKSNFSQNINTSKVNYLMLTGSIQKIKKILHNGFQSLTFQEFDLTPPKFLYIPIDIPLNFKQLWNQFGISLPECFFKSNRAMISSRDRFMVHSDAKKLQENIRLLEQKDFSKLRKLGRIRKVFDPLLENESTLQSFSFTKMKESISPINYRPLDIRSTIFYTINRRCGKSITIDHIFSEKIFWSEKFRELSYSKKKKTKLSDYFENIVDQEKLAYNFVQSVQKPPFRHFWITYGMVDSGLFGYSTSKVAPWYIDGKSNLKDEIVTKFKQIIPNINLDTILNFIYGLLLSDYYGKHFLPVLLHEYPKILIIPHPKSEKLIKLIAVSGKRCKDLHIGNFTAQDVQAIKELLAKFFYKIPEERYLHSFRYEPVQQQLNLFYIKKDISKKRQISIQLPLNLWNFKIGSVPIIKNWLKAHKMKKLESNWKSHHFLEFCAIYYVITQTLIITYDVSEEVEKYCSLTELPDFHQI